MTNYSKRTKISEQVSIYLGSPFFNDVQIARVDVASAALEKNDSVHIVHFPFDHQYGGVSVNNDDGDLFGSQEWQTGTYQNDLSAMSNADIGVFLYDVDQPDDGCAFEIGFMRALQKPCVIVLLSEGDIREKELNLMISKGGTYFMESMEELADYDFNHPLTNLQELMPVF